MWPLPVGVCTLWDGAFYQEAHDHYDHLGMGGNQHES